MSLRERLGLEQPIVGAGLGGGLSRAGLTVAIAEAGGLGQRPGTPLLGPAAATVDDPDSLLDSGPLFAGKCVARIQGLLPAAEVVRRLADAPAVDP